MDLPRRWEREVLDLDLDQVAFAPASDERDAVADADKSGAAVSVHHSLVRLKGGCLAELLLQQFRAGDGIQAESRSSFGFAQGLAAGRR